MTEFEQIMSFAGGENKRVFNELLDSIKHKSVLPFIGAGMSVPIYPTWKDVLSELGNIFENISDKHEEFERIINSDDPEAFMKAADIIDEQIGSFRRNKRLQEIFNEKKLDNQDYSLLSAQVLPHLFPNSTVITTNFDQTIEHIFDDHGKTFRHIIIPNKEIPISTIQENENNLIKLHGDISDKTSDERSIIFSKDEYDHAYNKKDSVLVSTLKHFYTSKKMLFLGCSLKYDRTMEVLKKIIAMMGTEHFAIVPNALEKQFLENMKFLGDYHIQAIYYDSNNPPKHGAVQIILEELLRNVDADGEYRIYTDSKPVKPDINANPFLYTTRASAFYGRENEIKELQAFADSSDSFRWWSIIGGAGQGKSRLALEFGNILQRHNWQVIRLEERQYNTLDNVNNELRANYKSLVIIDYAYSHAKELGKWMRELTNWKYGGKVRVLLLERERISGNGNELSKSVIDQGIGLRESLWKKQMISLGNLSEDSIKRVISSFAHYRGKPINDEQVIMIVRSLKHVDEKLERPLFAQFLTDAFCNGKDLEEWDRQKVLEDVLNREDRLIRRNMISYSDDVTEKRAEIVLRTVINPLRVISVFSGDISINEIEKLYQNEWKVFSDQFQSCKSKAEKIELLKKIGLVDNVVNKGEIIKAIQPHLLGEYFIIMNMDLFIPLFFSSDWVKNQEKLYFLFRLIIEYHDVLKGKDAFFQKIWDANPVSIIDANSFAKKLAIISGYIPYCAVEAVETLRKIYEKKYNYYKNDKEKIYQELALAYAKGLSNLTYHQSLEKMIETIEKLRQLSEKYKEDYEIALTYAKGLSNLTYYQNDTDMLITIKKLRTLSEKFDYRSDKKYYRNYEIALAYVKGLLAFTSIIQTSDQMAMAIDELRKYANEYGFNSEIQLVYVKGLYNQFNSQNPKETEQIVIELNRVESYHENAEISLVYAKVLSCLAKYQEIEQRKQTVKKIEKIYNTYKNTETALCFAKGLSELTYNQQWNEMVESVNMLYQLSENYPGNYEISLSYAKGLTNLTYTNQQTLGDVISTVETLRKLAESFKDDYEITLAYAKALSNLTYQQNLEKAENTVEILQKLTIDYDNDAEIALTYAKGLSNLTYSQNYNAAESTVEKLRIQFEDHSSNDEIALAYAKGLFNLAHLASKEKRAEYEEKILKLKERVIHYLRYPIYQNNSDNLEEIKKFHNMFPKLFPLNLENDTFKSNHF